MWPEGVQWAARHEFWHVKHVRIEELLDRWKALSCSSRIRLTHLLVYDSQWHWLNGASVDSSVVTWCPNSSYEIAIGTQCLAYDSSSHCVTNYPCDTLFPAPCVSSKTAFEPEGQLLNCPGSSSFAVPTSGAKLAKSSKLLARASFNNLCSSSAGDAYANWWTYTVLLLHWFTLFCFFLYLCNRFLLDKNTLILTAVIVLLSFLMIMTFAILWGVQCKSPVSDGTVRSLVSLDQDIIQIPLAIVILGCLAIVLLILVILIVLSNRTRGKETIWNFLRRKTSFSPTLVVMHDCHSCRPDRGEFSHARTDSLHCILLGLHHVGIVKSG